MILKLLLYLHNEKKSNSIRSILQGFLATLTEKEIQKVKYVLSLLGTEDPII